MLAHVRHEFPEILRRWKDRRPAEALAKKLLEVLNSFRAQYVATAAKRPA